MPAGPVGAAIPKAPEPGLGSESRGGGVARSPSSRKVSVAPARRRAADRAKQAADLQERAAAGSAPPPAPRCSGSRAPLATRPAQPGQSQAQQPAAPPARPAPSGGREGRGGGAPVRPIDPTAATPPGRTGQGGPLTPGTRPLSPLWPRIWAGPHAPFLPALIQGRPHCPPLPGRRGPARCLN